MYGRVSCARGYNTALPATTTAVAARGGLVVAFTMGIDVAATLTSVNKTLLLLSASVGCFVLSLLPAAASTRSQCSVSFLFNFNFVIYFVG